jgi:hypothetical protein
LTWDLKEYQAAAEEIEPASRVVAKDHWFWTAVWVLGMILTLGLLALGVSLADWRRRAATVGPLQGYPSAFPPIKSVIAHEARHTWQCQAFGWIFAPLIVPIFWRTFRAWCGLLPFLLFYFVFPFPVWICWGRFRLELSAAKGEWKYLLKRSADADYVRVRAKSFSEAVGSGQYFWPWPKARVMAAFEKAAEKMIKEAGK